MNLSNISSAARSKLIQEAWKRAQAQIQAQGSRRKYTFRGNQALIQTLTDDEIILAGPARTGKSVAWLYKLDDLAWMYPKMRALIVRKTRVSLTESGLVTFEQILGENSPICAGAQRANRSLYKYPNGSEIVVGGIDRPSRIMSTEFDFIYVQEASELTLDDWETLGTRLSNGVMPFQQIVGDTNPDRADHWIVKRSEVGFVKMLDTHHRDNPIWYDDAGKLTERGIAYIINKLGKLTGVRKERLLEGKWVNAEGAVYPDWNPAVHVLDRFEIPAHWRRFRAIDFGYTNPFVCQWWAMDEDGRLYLYREIYKTQRTVAEHAEQIKRLSEGERIEKTSADHDAEDRATLRKAGIHTEAARKAITVGIQAVQRRMSVAGDGKPRIFILRDSLVERDEDLADAGKPVCTLDEIGGYIWQKAADGKPVKEQPVDVDNHGMDSLRYMVMSVDDVGPVKVEKRNPFYR